MKITQQMKIDGIYISSNGKIYEKQPDDFTGVYREWWGNGQLMYEIFVKNGKDHGRSSGWYTNGKLKFEFFYKNGKFIK